MRHFLTLNDFSKDELLSIINLALELKAGLKSGKKPRFLDGKILALVFEKSSTRTRVSFESGIIALGGHSMFLSSKDLQLDRGECIPDSAKVISAMVDMIVLRTAAHKRLQEFALNAAVPVINGLSDDYHPMQLMADYLTMVESGIFVAYNGSLYPKGENLPRVLYVGDGNNMANSWINLAAILGFTLDILSPKGYLPNEAIIANAKMQCEKSGGNITLRSDISALKELVARANVIATDAWVSMGQEAEKVAREKAFAGFCIDEALLDIAEQNAIFLHCLPAYRGQEVSEGVLTSKKSKVFEAATNRLHAQKAVMLYLARVNNLISDK